MNNVEKIKQEAQNLRDKLNDRVNENEFIAGEVFILNYFLSYIDLHNEPVSIDFEQELYKAFGQVKDFTLGMRIAKWFYGMGKNSQEPVSEDLEQASEDYRNPWLTYAEDSDGELILTNEPCERAFIAGAEWQKQQMMAKAIDATIEEPVPLLWRVLGELEGLFVAENNLHDGDGVKVIIVKED